MHGDLSTLHARHARSLWAALGASGVLHLLTISLLLLHMAPLRHPATGEAIPQARHGRRLLEDPPVSCSPHSGVSAAR